MVPEHLRFGGGAAETTILPLMALCLLTAVVLILTLPRGKAITPFLMALFTVPVWQVVVLGGFHFTAPRILILAALAKRAIPSGASESKAKYPGGFNAIDWAVLLWSISTVVAFLLQFLGAQGTQALIQVLGNLVDILGGYLAVRFLIPDGDALRRTIKTLAAICVIQGVPMVIEQITRINVFGFVAGVPLAATIRDGSVRASGTMGALTAGPFAAVLIPMFLWLWTDRKSRIAAFAGLAGAIAMVIASNSSTSWIALGGSLVGLAFWRLRKRMRLVRWGLVTTLVGLHLNMKAPVWALISRVDLTGSSSSYQRYILVDMTIRRFSTWWLMGNPDYVNWGWDSWDLCNQFVAVALTGGLLTLILYLAIFKRSFGAIGRARKLVEGDRRQEWFLWCLGSTLFATVVAHFGINYTGVLIIGFFALVAFISVATFETSPVTVRTAEAPADVGFAFPTGAEQEKATSWLKA
jgi:hypothetical protein